MIRNQQTEWRGGIDLLDPGAVQNAEGRMGIGETVRDLHIQEGQAEIICDLELFRRERDQLMLIDDDRACQRNNVARSGCHTLAAARHHRSCCARTCRGRSRMLGRATAARFRFGRTAARSTGRFAGGRPAAIRIVITIGAKAVRTARTGRRGDEKNRQNRRDCAFRSLEPHECFLPPNLSGRSSFGNGKSGAILCAYAQPNRYQILRLFRRKRLNVGKRYAADS